MTARSLINSPAVKNLGSTVRENKKLMIVISILHLLGIPMGSVVMLVQLWLDSLQRDELYYAGYVDLSGYMLVAVFCLGAALLCGIVAATGVFQELWKKTRVDMSYALPMTGSQRFFSQYLAGTVVYALPYLIGCLLGWIILLTGGAVLDFDALNTTRGEYFSSLFEYYTIGSIGAFLLMMLYYTTTVLLTVCCGTLFESIYTTLLLNCLVPGTFAAVLGVICSKLQGLSFEYLWQPVGYTSPAGGLIYLIYLLSTSGEIGYSYHELSASQATTHGMIPAFIRWTLIMIVLIAAVLVLAWQLYKKRRAEAIGQPFVYKLAYYIMLTLLTVLILCLSAVGMETGAILFAGIVYLIMEVVRKRGFRRFWLSIISFVCTAALVFGLFAAVTATKLFGAVYRIPSAATVSSVKLRFNDMLNGDTVELEYTDKDVLRAVQELHKDITADMKEYGSTIEAVNTMMAEGDYKYLSLSTEQEYPYTYRYTLLDPEEMMKDKYNGAYLDYSHYIDFSADFYNYVNTQWLEITYYTVTGSTVHREFDLNHDQYIELLDIVYGTELYAQMYADAFYQRLINSNTEYDENGNPYLISTGELYLYYGDAEYSLFFHSTEELFKRLRDAYYNDLLAIDPAETGGVYAHWNYGTIWNCCTETIAVLEEMGMTPFNAAEKIGFADKENPLQYYMEEDIYTQQKTRVHIRIYRPEDIRFASESGRGIAGDTVYIKKIADCYEDEYYGANTFSMREFYPDLYALMDVLVQGEVTENCCMVAINGEWWAVPEEHSDLAEKVMANEDHYAAYKYQDGFRKLLEDEYGDALNGFGN